MSSENEDIHKNDVSLKEYVDSKIRTIEVSTALARENMEKRLEGMNEFRNSLKDQNSTFMSRLEYEAKHTLLENRLREFKTLFWIGIVVLMLLEIALRFMKVN